MPFTDSITPLIITYNEAPNIGRTLAQLRWAKRVIILDSYSTDNTLEIARGYANVEILQRPFDTFAGQLNYGLAQINSLWALTLDADYFITEELIQELHGLTEDAPFNSYFISFKFCIFGKPLTSTILPARDALFRRDQATFVEDGHAQKLSIKGPAGHLKGFIHHDDRKEFSRWLWAQSKYMPIETEKLSTTPLAQLSFPDRVRKKKRYLPLMVIVFTQTRAKCLFDGWIGWHYSLQRAVAEALLAMHLIEHDHLAQHQNFQGQDLAQWLREQDTKSIAQAKALLTGKERSFYQNLQSMRLVIPLALIVYCALFMRLGADRWQRLFNTYQLIIAELLVSLRLIEYQSDTAQQEHAKSRSS